MGWGGSLPSRGRGLGAAPSNGSSNQSALAESTYLRISHVRAAHACAAVWCRTRRGACTDAQLLLATEHRSGVCEVVSEGADR